MSPNVTRLARAMGVALGTNSAHARERLLADFPDGKVSTRYRLPFLGSDFALCARIHGWTDNPQYQW